MEVRRLPRHYTIEMLIDMTNVRVGISVIT